MKQPLLKQEDKPLDVVEGRRWIVLLAFSWIEFNQALVWITYSASAPEARQLYGPTRLTTDTINLLLNWGPIMYLVFVPVVMVMLNSNVGGKGVYNTILVGAFLCAAGSLVRMVPTFGHFQETPAAIWLIHGGQILNGLAGPSMAGACTAFAACWFAPDERTLATAIAYGICALGPALAFIFAMGVRTGAQLETLLLLEMFSSVGSCLLWLLMPSVPKVAPSASQAKTRAVRGAEATLQQPSGGGGESMAEFFSACRKACTNVSFLLLMTSGGIVFGVFQCWASSLTNTIKICPSGTAGSASGSASDAGVQQHSDDAAGCMSEELTQWLGFGGNIGTWFGTLVIGPIADRWFERRFKGLLLGLFAVQVRAPTRHAQHDAVACAVQNLMAPFRADRQRRSTPAGALRSVHTLDAYRDTRRRASLVRRLSLRSEASTVSSPPRVLVGPSSMHLPHMSYITNVPRPTGCHTQGCSARPRRSSVRPRLCSSSWGRRSHFQATKVCRQA